MCGIGYGKQSKGQGDDDELVGVLGVEIVHEHFLAIPAEGWCDELGILDVDIVPEGGVGGVTRCTSSRCDFTNEDNARKMARTWAASSTTLGLRSFKGQL